MIRPPMSIHEPVVFTTRAEAEQWVAGVLGEWSGEFDTVEICSECFEWDSAIQGVRLTVTDEQFWQIVQQHERSPQ